LTFIDQLRKGKGPVRDVTKMQPKELLRSQEKGGGGKGGGRGVLGRGGVVWVWGGVCVWCGEGCGVRGFCWVVCFGGGGLLAGNSYFVRRSIQPFN